MASETHEPTLRALAVRLAAEVDALNESLTWERDAIRARMQMVAVDVEAEVARYRKG